MKVVFQHQWWQRLSVVVAFMILLYESQALAQGARHHDGPHMVLPPDESPHVCGIEVREELFSQTASHYENRCPHEFAAIEAARSLAQAHERRCLQFPPVRSIECSRLCGPARNTRSIRTCVRGCMAWALPQLCLNHASSHFVRLLRGFLARQYVPPVE